jgi:hypothetical protein
MDQRGAAANLIRQAFKYFHESVGGQKDKSVFPKGDAIAIGDGVLFVRLKNIGVNFGLVCRSGIHDLKRFFLGGGKEKGVNLRDSHVFDDDVIDLCPADGDFGFVFVSVGLDQLNDRCVVGDPHGRLTGNAGFGGALNRMRGISLSISGLAYQQQERVIILLEKVVRTDGSEDVGEVEDAFCVVYQFRFPNLLCNFLYTFHSSLSTLEEGGTRA